MKTQAALAAKAIKTELKAAFPKVKFSVTSDNFSGGNSVRISWVDGPTYDLVAAITKKYQYGHFDGMTDSYEYSNNRDDIPQAKFVQNQRTVSEQRKNEIWENLVKTMAGLEGKTQNDYLADWNCWASQMIQRVASKTTFECGK